MNYDTFVDRSVDDVVLVKPTNKTDNGFNDVRLRFSAGIHVLVAAYRRRFVFL